MWNYKFPYVSHVMWPSAEVDIDIALRKGGLDGGSGGLGHWGNGVGTPGHVSPPDSENATVQNAVMDRDRRGSITRFDRSQRIAQQSLMWPSAQWPCTRAHGF